MVIFLDPDSGESVSRKPPHRAILSFTHHCVSVRYAIFTLRVIFEQLMLWIIIIYELASNGMMHFYLKNKMFYLI